MDVEQREQGEDKTRERTCLALEFEGSRGPLRPVRPSSASTRVLPLLEVRPVIDVMCNEAWQRPPSIHILPSLPPWASASVTRSLQSRPPSSGHPSQGRGCLCGTRSRSSTLVYGHLSPYTRSESANPEHGVDVTALRPDTHITSRHTSHSQRRARPCHASPCLATMSPGEDATPPDEPKATPAVCDTGST
jgi:hypothetical protein